MAALFEALALSGHRKTDGSVNASGKLWVYKPGTTSPAVIYADQDETPLSNPVTLTAGGKARVYFSGQVDAFFTDANNLSIETLPLSERAERVEVKSAGFTGLLPSGSQGGGGVTDLNAILTSIYASVGGLDGKYLEYTGATARKLQDVIRGIQVSVKDRGAIGNGVADDTIAIQSAINEVMRLGGGVVYFDPGTYIISSALTLSGASGVSMEGAGPSASVIKSTNGTANGLTISTCSSFSISNLGITHTSSSTGTGIAMSGCTSTVVVNVSVSAFQVAGSVTGASGPNAFSLSSFVTVVNSANARGLLISPASGNLFSVIGCTLQATFGSSLELGGSLSVAPIVGNYMPNGMVVTSTGVDSALVAANYLGSAGISFGVLASYPSNFHQVGNQGADGVSLVFAVGTTQTPTLAPGRDIRFKAGSGGAGVVTVNAPTPPPGPTVRDISFVITFCNASGGAVTWTLNPVYRVTGAISTTDGTSTVVTFKWDPDVSLYREVARAQTTT